MCHSKVSTPTISYIANSTLCPPQDMDADAVKAEPLIYCHFAQGIGEPKYLPVATWEGLNKTLVEALESYNDVNAAMNLVLFEDAMQHV